mmetsp:Transcript_50831/g.146675  ORF Transcript_50831/g.146675 Transcript_50831/m.146675 type:complete len:677 (-) Transcript_50831:30-2060(-)
MPPRNLPPVDLASATRGEASTNRGDAAAYVAVASSTSPRSPSGSVSPTVRAPREVRVDRSSPADAGASPRSMQVTLKHKIMLGGSVSALLVAAGAFMALCQTWAHPLLRGDSYRRIENGTCAAAGLLPVVSPEECAAAAKALHLHIRSVREVSRQSVEGLHAASVPEDCYYMVTSLSPIAESLWFNRFKVPHRKEVSASERRLSDLPGDISRSPICRIPPGRLQKEKEKPWSLDKIPGEVSGIEGQIAGMFFGSTTTSVTSTSTSTTTSSTMTTTTATATSTTSSTITSTTSSTETATSTITTTTTSTMTTTYHKHTSLFCFLVMRRHGYEKYTVEVALGKKTSVFDCNEYVVFSDEEFDIQPGEPVSGSDNLLALEGPAVRTTLLHRDLSTHSKAGSLEGILNTRIFMQAWRQIDESGRFRYHDWTVKVDPDAVFFPSRLRIDLERIAPASSAASLYIVNCEESFGLFGAVEVFSRLALETYIAGEERCMHELDWTMMGEDLWMRKCFDLLGVEHENDFNVLSDGYCGDDPSPCTSGKVAFHPLKSALSYAQCYDEAIKSTTQLASTAPSTSTVSKAASTDVFTKHLRSSTSRAAAQRSSSASEVDGLTDTKAEPEGGVAAPVVAPSTGMVPPWSMPVAPTLPPWPAVPAMPTLPPPPTLPPLPTAPSMLFSPTQ